MKSNKPTGIFLLVVPPVLFIIYTYLLFVSDLDIFVIKLTLVATVGVIISIFIWIGYTMLSTSSNAITDNKI